MAKPRSGSARCFPFMRDESRLGTRLRGAAMKIGQLVSLQGEMSCRRAAKALQYYAQATPMPPRFGGCSVASIAKAGNVLDVRLRARCGRLDRASAPRNHAGWA